MCVANGWKFSCVPFLNFIWCAKTCSAQGNLPIISDALPSPIFLDKEMVNRRNCTIMKDFPSLKPVLSGLKQNQVAGNLGAMRKYFQEKFSVDDFRRVEENSQSVEKMFREDTQTDIIALSNIQSVKGIADI